MWICIPAHGHLNSSSFFLPAQIIQYPQTGAMCFFSSPQVNFQKLQAKNIQHKKCEESSHVFSSWSHNRVDFNCAAKARRRAVILSACAAAVTLRCTRSPGPMTAQPLHALRRTCFPWEASAEQWSLWPKISLPSLNLGKNEFSLFVSSSSSSLTVRAVNDTLVSSVLVSGQTG